MYEIDDILEEEATEEALIAEMGTELGINVPVQLAVFSHLPVPEYVAACAVAPGISATSCSPYG